MHSTAPPPPTRTRVHTYTGMLKRVINNLHITKCPSNGMLIYRRRHIMSRFDWTVTELGPTRTFIYDLYVTRFIYCMYTYHLHMHTCTPTRGHKIHAINVHILNVCIHLHTKKYYRAYIDDTKGPPALDIEIVAVKAVSPHNRVYR